MQVKGIRGFGIPEHHKGELDYMDEITKTKIRREVAAGLVFLNAKDIIDFLNKESQGKETVKYFFKEIQDEQLNVQHKTIT